MKRNMQGLSIALGLTIAIGAGVPNATATDEQFPGGWCSFKLNGLDPTSPSDYEFDPVFGVLTMKNDGFWQILYQDRAGFGNPAAIPVDIPGVFSQFSLGGSEISVDLRGKSVIGVIGIDEVNASTTRRLRLILQNGGSVNAIVSARTYTLANSTISGNVSSAGTIEVKAILDIASGIELDIAGVLAGNVEVLNDIGSAAINSQIHIAGDVTTTGEILLGGILYGTIDAGSDMDGVICSNNALSGSISVANDVKGVIQFNGDVDGTIDVQGTIGAFDDFGSVFAQNLSGSITAGQVAELGAIGSNMFLSGGTISIAGDLRGRVNVSNVFHGQLTCDNLTSTGEIFSGGVFDGTILIANNLSGRIDSKTEIGGTVECHDLTSTGRICAVGGADLTGDLIVNGSVQSGGQIDVAGNMSGTLTVESDMGGTVHVLGNVVGTVGSVNDGHIIVNGSLKSSATITIDGQFVNGTEFIAVDYDGFDAADTWEDGATVSVDGDVYEGNSPSARVWEITQQLGDMNNDGPLNGGDIDPFFLALGDPAAYGVAFPGLAGSRVYHGDCNEDTFFNAADIDTFFCLLGGGPCGFNFMTPENIARMIETHVRPDRLERAILLVAEYVNVWATGQRRTFWREVLELLRPS